MGIAVRVTAQSISTPLIDSFEKICKKYPGNAAFKIFIKDETEAIHAESLSRNYRLRPVNECFQDLRKLAEVGVMTESFNVRWLTEDQSKPEVAEGIGTISSTFVLEEAEL
jgi:hypothetical protein